MFDSMDFRQIPGSQSTRNLRNSKFISPRDSYRESIKVKKLFEPRDFQESDDDSENDKDNGKMTTADMLQKRRMTIGRRSMKR